MSRMTGKEYLSKKNQDTRNIVEVDSRGNVTNIYPNGDTRQTVTINRNGSPIVPMSDEERQRRAVEAIRNEIKEDITSWTPSRYQQPDTSKMTTADKLLQRRSAAAETLLSGNKPKTTVESLLQNRGETKKIGSTGSTLDKIMPSKKVQPVMQKEMTAAIKKGTNTKWNNWLNQRVDDTLRWYESNFMPADMNDYKGIAEDYFIQQKMGRSDTGDIRTLGDNKLFAQRYLKEKLARDAKAKEEAYANLTEEEKQGLRNTAFEKNVIEGKYEHLRTEGVPYGTNKDGLLFSVGSDADQLAADGYLKKRPDDYWDGNKREDYDRVLYDYMNGEGSYMAAVDKLETDRDVEQFEAGIDALWKAIETGKIDDAYNYAAEESSKANQATVGDYGSTTYTKKAQQLAKEMERRQTVKELESGAPAGNSEYSLENITNRVYDEVDGIYYWANNLTDDTNTMGEQYANMRPEQFMTQEQLDVFNAYYNAGDKESAKAYYDALLPYLRQIKNETKNQYAYTMSQNEWATLMIGQRIGTQPLAGLTGTAGAFMALLGNEDARDPDSGYYDLTRLNQTIQGARAKQWGKQMAEWFGGGDEGTAAKFGEVLNNALYSMIDSFEAQAIGMGIGGVFGAGQTSKLAGNILQFVMSSEATAAEMYNNLTNNMDPTEAVLRAFGSGIIEWATEKYSTDRFFENYGKGNFWQQALANIVPEAQEEGASEILGAFMDDVLSPVFGHETEFQAKKNAYEKQLGDDPEADKKAFWMALRDFGVDLGIAMATGGLTGGVLGGGGAVMANVTNYNAYVQTGNETLNYGIETENQKSGKKNKKNKAMTLSFEQGQNLLNVLEAAEKMDVNSKSAELAAKLWDKVNNGKENEITPREVGELVRTIIGETGEGIGNTVKNSVAADVQVLLEGQGNKNAEKLSGIVAKAIAGEELTRTELFLLYRNDDAKELVRQYGMGFRYGLTSDAGVRESIKGIDEETKNLQEARESMMEMLGYEKDAVTEEEKTAAEERAEQFMASDVEIEEAQKERAARRESPKQMQPRYDATERTATEQPEATQESGTRRESPKQMRPQNEATERSATSEETKAEETGKRLPVRMEEGETQRPVAVAGQETKSGTAGEAKTQPNVIVDGIYRGIRNIISLVKENADGVKMRQTEVVLENGETVSISDVKADNQAVAAVLAYAADNGTNLTGSEFLTEMARAAEKMTNVTLKDAAQMIKAMTQIRLSAYFGINNTNKSNLPAEVQEELQDAAQKEFEADEKERTENGRTINPGQGQTNIGGVYYGTNAFSEKLNSMLKGVGRNMAKTIRNEAEAIAQIAKDAGFDVELYYDNSSRQAVENQGEFSTSGGIRINLAGVYNTEGAHRSALATFAHEVTHWLEANSQNAYRDLRNFVVKALSGKGYNIENRLTGIIQRYSANNVELDLAGAVAELVAKSSEEIFLNDQVIGEIRQQNPGLMGKIKEAVAELVGRLQNMSGLIRGTSSIYAGALNDVAEEYGKKWIGAYQEATGTKGTAAAGGSVQNSFIEVENNPNVNRKQTINLKSALKNPSRYNNYFTYDSLTQKDPIKAVKLGTIDTSKTRDEIVYTGMENARKNGKKVNGQIYVHVYDTGTDVRVTESGLRHGLYEKDDNQGITERIGEVLKESVLINTADRRAQGQAGHYKLLGAALNSDGNGITYALFSVNKTNNNVEKVDVLHAVRSIGADVAHNKKTAATGAIVAAKSLPTTVSYVNIADALEAVKEAFADSLPMDVLNRLGVKRPVTKDTGLLHHSFMETDEQYMQAVSSGDMDTAQRIVDEAARAAGYTTPKLYHGSPDFGFTEFDLEKGEQLIFATTDRRIGETYSGETERSKISERNTIDVDSLTGNALLREAKKYLSKYENYKLMSEQAKQEVLNDARFDFKVVVDNMNDFIKENESSFDKEKMEVANKCVEALDRARNAEDGEEFMNAWDEWENALWEFKFMDESVFEEFYNKTNRRMLTNGERLMRDFLRIGDIYALNDRFSLQYVIGQQMANELASQVNRGVYELYGNPGNQYEVEADGANWNQIPIDDEFMLDKLEKWGLTASNRFKTREIAAAAKANGFDSVLIRNVRDSGGATNYRQPSDVYIFFNESQVKSADAVVYDDKGNVIPPSERFNRKESDIRYSLAEEDIENENGDVMATVLPGGTVTKYSYMSWENEDIEELTKQLVARGFSKKNVRKWIQDVNGVAAMIAANKDVLDYEASPYFTMLKNNQEYVKTLDASTLCAKRLLYQGIFNEIQQMLPNTPILPDDLIKLVNMMKKKGLVTPCGICYVESRRRMLGKYAQEWLNSYNGKYIPKLAEVTTTDGLERLHNAPKNSPERQAYEDFVDAMNAKGSANPKVVQLRTDYRGEIRKMTANQIQKVKEIGGLRVQSFSDFETPHLIDMMQAVLDMAAMDLTSQAYTKVPEFAWVFGDTGIKINLSLIGEGNGLDENGKLIFSSTEGMDFDEAMKLRNMYSKNVGTILVGMNDAHIIEAMGDDRIDFIIPFHKSGWSKKEMARVSGMSVYKDYTRYQNEKKIASVEPNGKIKTIPNKKTKLKNLEPVGPNGYWDFNKTGTQNAEKYLQLCKEDGRVPKFHLFLESDGEGGFRLPTDNSEQSQKIRNGYWKTLIDFKMYDNEGKASPQTTVQPNFNMEAAKEVLTKYEGNPNTLPSDHELAKQFVKEYKEEHPGRKQYSFMDEGDMDVYQWMMGMPEWNLRSEAEKTMLRNFKSLRLKADLQREKIRNIQNDIKKLEEVQNKTEASSSGISMEKALESVGLSVHKTLTGDKRYDKYVVKDGKVVAYLSNRKLKMLNGGDIKDFTKAGFEYDEETKSYYYPDYKKMGSTDIRRRLEAYQIKLKNAQTVLDETENKLGEATSAEGFAGMMYQQERMLNDLIGGKTLAEVQENLREMEESVDEITEEIQNNLAALAKMEDNGLVQELNKENGINQANKTQIAMETLQKIQEKLENIRKSGQKAYGQTNVLSRDVNVALDYYNRIARIAEDSAKQRRTNAIIEQLKSEQAQKILRNNEEWRNLIERDKQAAMQLERNNRRKNVINTDIKRLMNLLKNPKGLQNIPEYMQGAARELIETFVNNDLEGGRRLTKADKKQLQEAKRLLNEWKKTDGGYNKLEMQLSAGSAEVADVIDRDLEVIGEAIKAYNAEIRGKNKLDTMQQRGAILEQMQEAVSEIYQAIRAEGKINLMGHAVEVLHQADKIEQATGGKRKEELTGALGGAIRAMHKAIVSGNMTPEYFFRTLGNKGLTEIWEGYHDAENRTGLELAKAKARLEEIAARHGYNTWDTKQKITVPLHGGDVEMTLGQIMSLYATWKRETTLGPAMSEHLKKGGFYVEQDLKAGILGRTVMDKKAHRVNEADMAKVGEILSEEQKAYIDDIVNYMSTDMSELGNDASMKAYGIKMYKETYYFPFKIWDGIKNLKSNDAGNGASGNQAFHPSFSKSRLHGASNALMLGDFTETAADHIVGMINYATMGLANDNLNKVLNFQIVHEGQSEDETFRNVRAIIEEAYGEEAMKYLWNLQQQLNGGAVKTEKTLYDKMISLFRKNAVAGSLSVAAQQPLSYIRAATIINPKYLARALSPDMWKGSYKEMMEHSGVAVIKEMGKFDMNAGQSAREYIQPEGKEGKFKTGYNWVSDKLTILPEMMDRMTWTRMWSAVKAEQKALYPGMDVKSDAFLDMVGERFNELMRRTQVYDSALVRSKNMLSQNPVMKSLTSFMAEPTLTANVLADAVRSAKSGEKGGKALLAKAGATFLLSAAAQAAIKALFSASRSPDDKKTKDENYLYRFWNALISEADPMQLIPGYSDAVALLKDGELSDDAWGAVGKIISAAKTGTKMIMGQSDKGTWRDLEDSVGQLLQLISNVPAKNISRDIRAMFNWFINPDAYAGRETSEAVMKYQFIDALANSDNLAGAINQWLVEAGGGYDTSTTGYYKRVYEATKAGNTEEAQNLIDYLLMGKGVKKESTITTKVLGYVKEDYADGKITREQAEDLYKKEKPDIKTKDLYEALDEVDYEAATGENVENYSNYTPLKNAMAENDEKAIAEAKKHLLEIGYKESDILSAMKNEVKSWYKKGDITRKEAEKLYKKYDPKATDKAIMAALDEVDYEEKNGDVDSYSNYTPLYEAMEKGDVQAAKAQREKMKKAGYTDNDINEQLKTNIKNAYEDGKISKTEAEKRLKTYANVEGDEAWWTIDRVDFRKATGKDPGGQTYYRLYDAIEKNNAQAITSAIQVMTAHGIKTENIKNQLPKAYKSDYLEATGNAKVKMKDALIKAYKAIGVSEAEANNIINKWK